MEIRDTAAMVSGGGSGIGRAMVMALANAGARVVVADVDVAGGEATARMVAGAGGIAAFRRCDVTNAAELRVAIGACAELWGRLDIVCNNAGIGDEDLFGDEMGRWRRTVDINLTAVIDGTRLAVNEMRRLGKGGVIINTASMGGLLPMPGSPVYAATKAGVVNFSRSLAYLALESGIRVNAICPSYVDTPLVRRSGDERVEAMKLQVGGILQPEDIAAGVVELVEDDSRAGAIMRVTVRGGRDYARDVRP